MAERGNPLEQRPPKPGRARTGIPRAVVRRDIFDRSVTPYGPAPAAPPRQPTTAAPRMQPAITPHESSEDSDDEVPPTIVTRVVVPTLRYDMAKRTRPCTSSSSSNSDEQEDKRLKLSLGTSLALPAPSEYVASPRSPSPSERPPLPALLPPLSPLSESAESASRAEASCDVSRPPLSHSRSAESIAMLSRSDSAQSPRQSESASWPKNSTSYAALASPVGRQDVPMVTPRASPAPPHQPEQPAPPSPQPSTSYAAAAAAPPAPRRSPVQAEARNPPATAGPSATTEPPARAPRSAYPPLVVESLPNWPRHFAELRRILGHAPHARPLGGGMRFLPSSAEEFRAVQRYLTEVSNRDNTITWYCYSPATEVPVKVAIRGLPLHTPTDDIIAALSALGFPAEAARAIPSPAGRNGCTYYVRLAHLTHDELRELYSTTELLFMPGVTIEAWRGGSKPPQCHRCQSYGHNSVNCHRRIRCVRCAGEHTIRDCPRPRDAPPTCANCGLDHAANDRGCTFYKREARRRGINQPPPPPRTRRNTVPGRRAQTAPAQPTAPPAASGRGPHGAQRTATAQPAAAQQHTTEPPSAGATQPQTAAAAAPTAVHPEGPTTLAPPANPPTERGLPVRRKRRRRNRAPRPQRTQPAAASTPQPQPQLQPQPQPRPGPRPPPRAPQQAPAPRAQPAPQPVPQPAPAPAPSNLPRQAHGGPTTRATTRPSGLHTAATHTTAADPNQGEAQTNPDIMAIVRVVVEALTAGMTAYLQGQGVIPAITAGLVVITNRLRD